MKLRKLLSIFIAVNFATNVGAMARKRTAIQAELEDRADAPKSSRLEEQPAEITPAPLLAPWPRRMFASAAATTTEISTVAESQEQKISAETHEPTPIVTLTTVREAVIQNNATVLKQMIESGEKVESEHFVPLSVDANPFVIELLCNHGANPNVDIGDEDRIIHILSCGNNYAALKALINNASAKVELNQTNYDRKTALQVAAQAGHERIVALLVKQPNIQFPSEKWITGNVDNKNIAQLLRLTGCIINHKNHARFGNITKLLANREIGKK